MKEILKKYLLSILIFATALTMGCSTSRVQEQSLYDFGLLGVLPPVATPLALPLVSVADINAPAWMDSTGMVYRLGYANNQQMRSYANSRWAMPPAKLFEQRFKARIAQSGGSVLSLSDGAANLPLIRMDAEDFSQVFDSATQSAARVKVRVSVLRGRSLLAQKTFAHQSPAPTADAAGGAVALAAASDALIGDVMMWLAKLPLQ